MRGLTLAICLVLAVSIEARSTWMPKWNCKNMFGVHLNVRKMLAEVDVNKDNKITINEDRASYANYDIIKRDGSVSLTEFIQRMMNEFCYPKAPAAELFLLFDTNKDGVLTPSDTDPNSSLFDAQGTADISVMIKGLVAVDKLAQRNAYRKKNIGELIKQTYDGNRI